MEHQAKSIGKQQADPAYIDLLDLYHLNTQHLLSEKKNRKAYQTHFHPRITRLMSESGKSYQNRPTVRLPHSDLQNALSMSVGETLIKRRSVRDFASGNMDLAQLAIILHSANGVHQSQTIGKSKIYRRTVPSAGNLGSVELYVAASRVAKLSPGLYHYDSFGHRLSELRIGSYNEFLVDRVLFQPEFASGAALLILTGATGRVRSKYGPRAYRYIHLDAGHVGQNIYLTCTALGLGCCGSAGFVDGELEDWLGIDGKQETITYLIAIGLESNG